MKKFLSLLKKYTVVLLLLILVVYFSVTTRNFASTGNLINMLRQVAILGILSIGSAMVIISGNLDLSIGSIISLVSCSTAMMILAGVPIVLAFLLGICIAIGLSVFNGLVIVATGMPAMICTLAMQQVLQGVTYILTGASPKYGMPDQIKILGQGYIGVIPVPVVIMIIVFIMGAFILNRTYIGRYFYAVGSNPEAARLSGLSVKKIHLLAYLINGIFAGIAGIVMMSRMASGQPEAGKGYEMDVITACVVGGVAFAGGKGKVSGVIQGVLVMGVLSNGLGVKGVDSYTQLLFKGVVLILVVGMDSIQQARAKNSKMKIEMTQEPAA